MELLAVITRFYACVRSAIYRIGFLSQIEANKVHGKKVDGRNRFLSFSFTFLSLILNHCRHIKHVTEK